MTGITVAYTFIGGVGPEYDHIDRRLNDLIYMAATLPDQINTSDSSKSKKSSKKNNGGGGGGDLCVGEEKY